MLDGDNYRVQKFDADNTFVCKWGFLGMGQGSFSEAVAIAVDATGSVYVADTNNHKIQKFDGNGVFLTEWGSNGVEDGQFAYPSGVAVSEAGDVQVSDTNLGRIQKSGRRTVAVEWMFWSTLKRKHR